MSCRAKGQELDVRLGALPWEEWLMVGDPDSLVPLRLVLKRRAGMSRKAGPRCFAVGLLWVCAMAGAARGQQPAAPGAAKVVIRLTDQSSTVVAGAQIQVAPLPERVPEKMQTDEKGELRLELKAGGYGLVVREPGFRVVITHIEVHGRGELEVFPLTLQVANMGGPVMVEGS